MLPSIISERLIHSFKFWDNGEIHHGMRCSTGLYRRIAVFELTQSQQAYSLGIALCQQQQAVLTKTEVGYAVWLVLRSNEVSHAQAVTSESLVLQP